MKYIPGHKFITNQKARGNFKPSVNYTVYHISPNENGVSYIFAADNENFEVTYESVEIAEAIITKMSK